MLNRLERRKQFEDGRSDAVGRLDLLEFELVAPGDQGTPDKLIGGDDDEHDGGDAADEGAGRRRRTVAVWI